MDATPNRLWIRERHTPQRLFVNYLPLPLAAWLAGRFSERVPRGQSVQRLLERGFRGCTYGEIARSLPGASCLNNVVRGRELTVWMVPWRRDSDTKVKRVVKDAYERVMLCGDPFSALFGLPMNAVMPWHALVFQKPLS